MKKIFYFNLIKLNSQIVPKHFDAIDIFIFFGVMNQTGMNMEHGKVKILLFIKIVETIEEYTS